MRQWAISVAAVGFFGLAAVGWLCGQPPLICALRAAAGAVVLYVVVRVATRLALNILVDAVMRRSGKDNKDTSS